MKISFRTILICMAVIACVMAAGPLYAASCPYCGQSYGEGAPGDESYIASIRAAHEASCSARSSGGGYGGYSGGGGESSWARRRREQQEYQEMLWQQEQERIRQEQERLRIEEEKRQQRIKALKLQREAGDARFQSEWAQKKGDLTGSLKGADGGLSLKSGMSSSAAKPAELQLKPAVAPQPPVQPPAQGVSKYYSTLKTNEVPSPDLSGKNVLPPVPKESAIGKKIEAAESFLEKNAPLVLEYSKLAVEKAREWYRDQVINNIYSISPEFSALKETFEKGKQLYEEMRDLRIGVYTHAMGGMKEGVDTLASPRLRDGGLSERYHEGMHREFKEVEEKTHTIIKDRIHGAGEGDEPEDEEE